MSMNSYSIVFMTQTNALKKDYRKMWLKKGVNYI